VSETPLYLSHEPGQDWLFALPFGAVSDGQPKERWRDLTDDFAFYVDLETGAVTGFGVQAFSELDVDDEALAEIWTGPRFDAPLLGLTGVSAGEIIIAARAHFGSMPSVNRIWFSAATGKSGEEALTIWQVCLGAGDSMAHFAIGYTHYELEHYHAAYRHLRHYAELAPAQPWVWVWYAQAAAASGETAEARDACNRALELTEAGSDETDAGDLLESLDG
jgi:tetratricopeptide (TPR) repeat protein